MQGEGALEAKVPWAGIGLSGCPCGKNRGRVSQEEGWKDPQRLGNRQQPERQVEGLGFLAGDNGEPFKTRWARKGWSLTTASLPAPPARVPEHLTRVCATHGAGIRGWSSGRGKPSRHRHRAWSR